VNEEGFCQVLGVVEGAKEDKEGWSNFVEASKEAGT